MNCKHCDIKFNKFGLKQHEEKCTLNKNIIDSIKNDYLNNFFSTKDITKKYKISFIVISRILGKNLRNKSLANKVSKKERKVSDEVKRKISIGRSLYLKNNPDKIKWVGNESIPCSQFKKILIDNNINFVEEFQPLKERFFCIDISFPDKKIGIEINGEQHYDRTGKLKKYYQERHDLIESDGWKLYEIHTSLVYKEQFIKDFLINLKSNYNLSNIDYSFFEKIKKENFCSCGKKIFKTSSTCFECFTKLSKKRKVNRPSYNILIEEIKKFGYSGTGKKYNVKGNSVKKWIKMYEKYGLNF